MMVSWIKFGSLKDVRNGHQKKQNIPGYAQVCPKEQHPNSTVSKADLSYDKTGSGDQQKLNRHLIFDQMIKNLHLQEMFNH